MKKILIYRDSGADPFCVSALVSALQQEYLHSQYAIEWADRHLLKTKVWMENTHILIFPGGRDIPYHRALQGTANENIREFVLAGGNYFGICAGSYYGSAFIEFEKGNKLEVIAQRELKFFPGIARGPAYGEGKFCYQSQNGAQIALLNLNPTFCDLKVSAAYYNGGCAFIDAETYEGISVVGRYTEIDGQPPAIIECKVGKGLALLCGVHPEYSSTHDGAMNFFNLVHFKALQAIESQRRQLFSSLLRLLK